MKFIISRFRPHTTHKFINRKSKPHFGVCACCGKFRNIVVAGLWCENPNCDGIPF